MVTKRVKNKGDDEIAKAPNDRMKKAHKQTKEQGSHITTGSLEFY